MAANAGKRHGAGKRRIMTEQSLVLEKPVEKIARPEETALDQLENQVERGSYFTHTTLGRSFMRIGEVESFAYGLIDALVAKGILSSEEIKVSVERVRQELSIKGDIPGTGVAIRIDREEDIQKEAIKVDCKERMNICHSICCKLDFALSISEVESGKVKWDLGRPYFIRHENNGYCTHNSIQTGNCRIYSQKPEVCRGYSCASDKRIWKDFEKMELNVEWIDENIPSSGKTCLLAALMHRPEDIKSIK